MTTFLFPGQGSQFVGMATDLFRADAEFRDQVRHASELTGEDLERVCLRGPDRLLRRTALLQPLLVAISLGYWRHLTGRGIQPDIVLGHSLGEISALAAAGILDVAAAIALAAQRGAIMEKVVTGLDAGMLAVTTLQREAAIACLNDLPVTMANDNAPHQFVLSGTQDALTQAGSLLTKERLAKCQPLPVSGPFHSPLMAAARDEFREALRPVTFAAPRCTIIMNGTGRAETDPARIKQLIGDALAAPVFWRDCMDELRRRQPRQLLEIGPGRVLSGLARANGFSNETETLSISDLRAVENVIATSDVSVA